MGWRDDHPTQHHGVHVGPDADLATVRGNVLSGNVGAAIQDDAGVATVAGNDGYATRDSGTTTLRAGDERAPIEHGLPESLVEPAHVSAVPVSDPAGLSNWYVSVDDDGECTVVVKTPPDRDVEFSWIVDAEGC